MIEDILKLLNSKSESDISIGIDIAIHYLTSDEIIILRKKLNPISHNDDAKWNKERIWNWSHSYKSEGKVFWYIEKNPVHYL